MGITRFPRGIQATPNLGGGRLAEIFQSENIWFVDGDVSGDGTGGSPTQGVAKISTAIGLASRGAVIYVKPKLTATSSQSYYQDDVVIAVSKPGMSIIGAGGGIPSAQSGVQLKPLTLTGNLIDVNAANTTIENMRLTLTGGTAGSKASIISAITVAANAALPSGLVVRGCRFENDKDHPTIESSTVIYGSIALGTTNDTVIEDNIFYNCLGGIVHQLSTGTTHGLTIRNNIFSGVTTGRDADILMNWAGWGLSITGNFFLDGLPAHDGGGTLRFIKVADAGTGIIANNFFASTAAAAQYGADGTDAIIPTTLHFVGNYNEDGVLAGGT